MQVEFIEGENLKRVIEITIPQMDLDAQCQKELDKAAKTIKLPGFRVGKVPMSVIKDKYEEGIRRDLLNRLIQEKLEQEIKERKLVLVDYPKVNVGEVKEGNLKVKAEFELVPVVVLPELKELTVEREEVQVTEEMVKEKLEEVRREYATYQQVEEAYQAQKGDQIIVDFIIESEGKLLANNENVKVVLGDGKTWKEFEDRLYGAKLRDLLEFALDIPEAHVDRNLAGKHGLFKVTVKELLKMELPEMKDEFVSEIFDLPSVEAFKERVREDLKKDFAKQANFKVGNSVFEKLGTMVNFPLPISLLNKYREEFKKRQKDWDSEKIEQEAKKQLKQDFLLQELIKKGNLTVSQEEIVSEIFRLTSMYYEQEEVLERAKQLYKNQALVQQVSNSLIEQKVMNYLLKEVQIVGEVVEKEIEVDQENKEVL